MSVEEQVEPLARDAVCEVCDEEAASYRVLLANTDGEVVDSMGVCERCRAHSPDLGLLG